MLSALVPPGFYVYVSHIMLSTASGRARPRPANSFRANGDSNALSNMRAVLLFCAFAVVPPGFYVSNGATVPCPVNSFRADWVAAFQATSCESCGEGVQLDKTEKIAVFDITTGAQTLLAVATSSEDCCKCWWLFVGGRGKGCFGSCGEGVPLEKTERIAVLILPLECRLC